ncbi:unnamed protein product [Eruca vesicaria subsp. sativa]|uniref:Bifunctional inhibitor/plant lipid transfer protein/seed storage helical domain-containing protein n=1 Tax=Eruca vesicaria subsp. sativa TaxID=29727 RepID=A0ABC8KFS9_ERUVS|nr:unnamed protein product [Eruca vesicaria subsp. sativa]
MKFTGILYIAFVIVLVSALAPATAVLEEKVECIPREIFVVCLPAYESGSPPSAECCGKLKEQESCFCDYLKNPVLAPYIDSQSGRKVLAACGIPYPTC